MSNPENEQAYQQRKEDVELKNIRFAMVTDQKSIKVQNKRQITDEEK
jgi:hypothetical protein